MQTAGFQDKIKFDMQSTDLVADLRAEIQAWFETKMNSLKIQLQENKDKSLPAANLMNILSAASNPDGQTSAPTLRLITQGQEVSLEADEKSLAELGFKDMQVVFVSQSSPQGAGSRNHYQAKDMNPFPGKEGHANESFASAHPL